MFDYGTFDEITFDQGLPDVAPSQVVFDSFDGRKKRKKQALEREQEFDEAVQNSSKLRDQLLKLYRGIDEDELAPIASAPVETPVKVTPISENLDHIVLQLSAISESLNTAQRRLVREYKEEMDRQDEEEIEMLLTEIF